MAGMSIKDLVEYTVGNRQDVGLGIPNSGCAPSDPFPLASLLVLMVSSTVISGATSGESSVLTHEPVENS